MYKCARANHLLTDSVSGPYFCMLVSGVLVCFARATHTLPPLYRQINREDRLVVREGVCVLGRKGSV